MARANASAGQARLVVATLGVVYGDIGTSPLYAFRQCFEGPTAPAPTPGNILGILSLILWALILVVSVKYVLFLMRADNRGEGGILALLAQLGLRGTRSPVLLVGLFGAALLYGDGMITPPISVLSAVEGLSVVTHKLEPWIVPATISILVALFAVQPFGAGRVARVFGPIMLLWFAVLGALGLLAIREAPEVLWAINPLHGVRFFLENGWRGFFVLGAVVLVVTGGEALYADMGQFGRAPVRLSWFGLVLPALVVNYLGQGAILMEDPNVRTSVFYRLAPGWALVPLVLLATTATIIASQALISAAFSMTRQAIQLGFIPRLRVVHTSSERIGQIYLPFVNWTLMIACVGLVVFFRASTRLADAYGLAVTGTMATTTVLYFSLVRRRYRWSLWRAVLVCGAFFTVDLSFLVGNLPKIPTGGWFPLLAGGVILTLLMTWNDGRRLVEKRLEKARPPLSELLSASGEPAPARVPGLAVFLSASQEGVPLTLVHNVRHNHVLHERNVILTLITAEVPFLGPEERARITHRIDGFVWMVGYTGFRERPEVPRILDAARRFGFNWSPRETTFFLGRETLLAHDPRHMALWRQKLFVSMTLNARNAGDYFNLPSAHTIELGGRTEL